MSPKMKEGSLTARQGGAFLLATERRQRDNIASMIARRKRYVSVVMYLLMKTSVALNVKSLRQEETSMFSWTSRVRMIHRLNP